MDNVLEQTKYPVWDDFLPVVPVTVVQAANDGYTQILAADDDGPRFVEVGVSEPIVLYVGQSAPADDTGAIRVEQTLQRVVPAGMGLFAKSLTEGTMTDTDDGMGDDTGDATGEIEITITPALLDHVEDDDPLIFPSTFLIRLTGAVSAGATQLQVSTTTADETPTPSSDLVQAARYFYVDGQNQIYEIAPSEPAPGGQLGGRTVTFAPALIADVADDTLLRFTNSYVPNRGEIQRLAFTIQADVSSGQSSVRLIGRGPDNLSGRENLMAGQTFTVVGSSTEHTINDVTELSAVAVPPDGAHLIAFAPALDVDVSAGDRVIVDLRSKLEAYDVTVERAAAEGATIIRFEGTGLTDINDGNRVTFPGHETAYVLSDRANLLGQTVRRFTITPALEAAVGVGVAPLMPAQSVGDALDIATRADYSAGAAAPSFSGADATLLAVGAEFTFEGHSLIYVVQTSQVFSTTPPIVNTTITPALEADVAMGTSPLRIVYSGPGPDVFSMFVQKENTDGITLTGSGASPSLIGANVVANVVQGDTFTIAGVPDVIYTITNAGFSFGTQRFPTVSPVVATAYANAEVIFGVGTPGTDSVLEVSVNNDGGYDAGVTEMQVDGDDAGNIMVGHIFGVDHLGGPQLVTVVPEPVPPDPPVTAAATDVSVQTWDDIEPSP